MRLLPSKLLRLLILLLLTVFITESVYASSKMAIIPFTTQKSTVQVNAESHAEHCHDMQSHSPESSQTNQKQSSHTHCSNHCFACFSMLTQAPLPVFLVPVQLAANTAFSIIYLSPASAQPQKPPIL